MNSWEFHGLVPVVVAVALPAELNFAVIEAKQAVVGDGDAVRVLRDVPENLFRPGKQSFGIHRPFDLSKRSWVQESNALDSR